MWKEDFSLIELVLVRGSILEVKRWKLENFTNWPASVWDCNYSSTIIMMLPLAFYLILLLVFYYHYYHYSWWLPFLSSYYLVWCFAVCCWFNWIINFPHLNRLVYCWVSQFNLLLVVSSRANSCTENLIHPIAWSLSPKSRPRWKSAPERPQWLLSNDDLIPPAAVGFMWRLAFKWPDQLRRTTCSISSLVSVCVSVVCLTVWLSSDWYLDGTICFGEKSAQFVIDGHSCWAKKPNQFHVSL